MPDETVISPALAALRQCRCDVRAARIDAQTAATRLTGVRAARAHELTTRLIDAFVWCDRLCRVIEGDLSDGADLNSDNGIQG